MVNAPMNLDGYVRVSQVRGREGDSFISPEQQADRIRAWAQAYGHTLDELFVELDQSGARTDRPMLEEALQRIEAGLSQGLIVPRVDRFGRSLIDGLAKIERIDKAGGAFVSVQDGFDLTTDTGRLVLRIMLSLAEFELDRIRSNWQDAKRRAVSRGVHVSAAPPFGYRREGPPRKPGGPATGPLMVDPVNGPLVTGVFERRASGEGFTSIARWLTEQGAVTQRGRTAWSLRAVKDIVRNRVYLGVAYAEDFENPGAHDPLTDRVTWERAQRVGQRSEARGGEPAPVCRHVLRCAGCRYKTKASRLKRASGEAVWGVSCRSTGDGAWRCEDQAWVMDRGDLDAIVLPAFFDRLPVLEARALAASPNLEQYDDAVRRARVSFEQWRDDSRVQERLGMDVYLDGLAQRKGQLEVAELTRSREAAKLDARALPFPAAQIREQWDTLTLTEQRALLDVVIEAVFIRGTSGSTPTLRERVRVVFRGDRAPLDLPRMGARGFEPRPVNFDDLDGDPPEV